MVVRISELKLKPDHTEKELEREIRKLVPLQGGELRWEIIRRSIDARKKPDLLYVYTVDVTVDQPRSFLKKIRSRKVTAIDKKEYAFPFSKDWREETETVRPVVTGSGPAGLFCALMLARSGLRPIVLERGEPVEQRVKTVEQFWNTGRLDPQSNVQFGEGGAGTFSDGKLNTLIKDPDGKIRFVLKEFVRAGASPTILYDHKPHIGTDVLVTVVKHIREEILSLGGEFRFGTCLTGFILYADSQTDEADNLRKETISPEENRFRADMAEDSGRYFKSPMKDGRQADPSGNPPRFLLELNGGSETLPANHLILAVGHSARDTFSMLYDKKLPMEAKSFAVGLRMEHSQRQIDDAMYGKDCPYDMGAAPYKVTHKCGNGRGVYSFCMCPGGYVVNASSEQGMTAVNGMSYSARDGENANSAIVVTVTPEDYQADHPLAGIRFQRTLEKAAYECGQGKIPVQRFEDFCENRASGEIGQIKPQCRGGYTLANLRTVLPENLNESIIEGVKAFGRRIPGFDHPDALLSGVESRTSSPVRILRDERCQTVIRGVYPCGEGAGYAGGITSAAVDGIRVAEAVCREMRGRL